MNNSAGRKLKSQSGASLVLAILVFLICALVGSTILAAATASSGTLTETSKNDKSTYTLISAEKMFEQSFETKLWKAVDYTNIDSTTGNIKDVPVSPTMDTLYQYLCITTYNNSSASWNLTYTLSDYKDPTTGNTISVSPVNVKITMDKSYNITAVFTQADSTRTVVLNLPAATGTGSNTRAIGSTVSWSTPSVTIQ